MAPQAEVICDSITEDGTRLTTMVVTIHRFVLAEINTHRIFSRSSASSRAIPVQKQLDKLRDNPAMPLEYPAEQSGMQGGRLLCGDDLDAAQYLFDDVYRYTLEHVQEYVNSIPKEQRLHKSLVNRLLEPFMWHTVIVASTEWENFFRQRVSELAQPEIRVPAEMMLRAFDASTPVELAEGEWHLPFLRQEDNGLELWERIACSVARCARVSYENHDGVRSIQDDLNLFHRLGTADPPHWAPMEMAACVGHLGDFQLGNFASPWRQLRHNKMLTQEILNKIA